MTPSLPSSNPKPDQETAETCNDRDTTTLDTIFGLSYDKIPQPYQAFFHPEDLILFRKRSIATHAPDQCAPEGPECDKYMPVLISMIWCSDCSLDAVVIWAAICLTGVLLILVYGTLGLFVFFGLFIPWAVGWEISNRLGKHYCLGLPRRMSRYRPHRHVVPIFAKKLHLMGLWGPLSNLVFGLVDIYITYETQRQLVRLDPSLNEFPLQPRLELLDWDPRLLVLRLHTYPKLVPGYPRFRWLEKLYQHYRLHHRSVYASWLHRNLVYAGNDASLQRVTEYSISKLEEEGERFLWATVPSFLPRCPVGCQRNCHHVSLVKQK